LTPLSARLLELMPRPLKLIELALMGSVYALTKYLANKKPKKVYQNVTEDF